MKTKENKKINVDFNKQFKFKVSNTNQKEKNEL